MMLLVGADVGRIDEALAGKGEARRWRKRASARWRSRCGRARCRHSPIVSTTSERAPVERGDDRVRGEVVRKGEVGFDAEQQAGRQSNIVAALHAADHAAEDAAGGRGRQRIGQHRGSKNRGRSRYVRRCRSRSSRTPAGRWGALSGMSAAIAGLPSASAPSAAPASDMFQGIGGCSSQCGHSSSANVGCWSRIITADLNACRHPSNEVINPVAPDRIPAALPVSARSGSFTPFTSRSLLQVIRNSKKGPADDPSWMAPLRDVAATRPDRPDGWRPVQGRPPEGTTGRVGCGIGLDRGAGRTADPRRVEASSGDKPDSFRGGLARVENASTTKKRSQGLKWLA